MEPTPWVVGPGPPSSVAETKVNHAVGAMTDAAAETKTMRAEASEQDEGREVDPNEDVPTTTNVAEPNPDANPDGNEPEPEPEPEVEPHAAPSLGAVG